MAIKRGRTKVIRRPIPPTPKIPSGPGATWGAGGGMTHRPTPAPGWYTDAGGPADTLTVNADGTVTFGYAATFSGAITASSDLDVAGDFTVGATTRITMGGAANDNGIVFGSLGTATKAIDLENSGLSGNTDYLLYYSSTRNWTAGGRLYTGNVHVSGVQGPSDTTNRMYMGNQDPTYVTSPTRTLLIGSGSDSQGSKIASLTSVTVSGSDLQHADIDTDTAAGDLVHIVSGTGATPGFYRITVVGTNEVTVDRAPGGSGSNIALTLYQDFVGIFATDSTNGQRIMNYSHQDKPLQIGGDVLNATGHSLGSEDVLIGNMLEVDGAAYFDGEVQMAAHTKLHITDTDGDTEGDIWYDASEDKLKFKTAAGVETVTSA